ncbi:MAG: competence/damage-inducible protein A [Methylotenera sp.]|nr:competence/damage-inducible protein A [Methylotenera sp.]
MQNTVPEFGLVIVGDEILSGKRQDKHLSKVIELLSLRGLSIGYADYVGDDPRRLTQTLHRAFHQPGVVFCCGGIGATPDDHTRQSAAAALGLELVLHPEAEQLIRERTRDVALEQGLPYEPLREDNMHRLNMGRFPVGAEIIPNPYNKIPGFTCRGPAGTVHFVPGFPVMAWPMIDGVLTRLYAGLSRPGERMEKSVIVMGSMEATLTPLMEAIEAEFADIKVFSLPSVDHPEYGRHIELGVKGPSQTVESAFAQLVDGLHKFGAKLGPELVR